MGIGRIHSLEGDSIHIRVPGVDMGLVKPMIIHFINRRMDK